MSADAIPRGDRTQRDFINVCAGPTAVEFDFHLRSIHHEEPSCPEHASWAPRRKLEGKTAGGLEF